ncbi:MAG: Hsp33 family molecular chaperone HslO [Gemmatimonadetes bacterium]|nr:Hsp33 family molecular chaperone HslO [Gemmatimonadota bacterium]
MDAKSDYMVRATACDGLVRAFSVVSTGITAELKQRHGTEPAVTAALGRLTTGTLMFSALLEKDEHTVSIRVVGDGPAGVLLAAANGGGDVRGLVAHPVTGADQVSNGKLNVSGVVGRNGRLTVTRDLGLRHPYVGVVELVSGEIGEDLAHYLVSSEQTPSAVGVGVFVDGMGEVVASGGFMVQMLPGVSNRAVTRIEDAIRALPHPTAMIRSGESPEDVLARIFPDGFELLDRVDVRFHCPCTIERVERALALLGEAEVRSILEKDRARGVTEVTCEFCGAQYTLDTATMEAIARRTRH